MNKKKSAAVGAADSALWYEVTALRQLFQPQLLDLAGNGIAPNAQLLGGFNAPAFGAGQSSQNQARFETVGQRIPDIGSAST